MYAVPDLLTYTDKFNYTPTSSNCSTFLQSAFDWNTKLDNSAAITGGG